MDDTPYPDFIYREEEAVAEPCFRTMLYFQKPLRDSSISEGTVGLFNTFIRIFSEHLNKVAIAGDEIKGLRLKKITPERLAEAETWLREAHKSWPATCRIVGPLNQERETFDVPALRIEQGAQYSFMDFSVPHNPELSMKFANEATEILKTMPVLCGVMGMGFYLPPAWDSLENFFPRAYPRFRTALEFMVEGGEWGIHKEIGHTPWDDYPDIEPGIVDVGWRTFLGSYYLDRLPNLDEVSQNEDVTLERTQNMAILTAGKEPIWGDVNMNEDISAYQKIATALEPVRFPIEAAVRGLFGGNRGNHEAIDRIEAYLKRYD